MSDEIKHLTSCCTFVKPEPTSLTINLDAFGYGAYEQEIKDIHINIDKETFIFTKEDLKELLTKFKKGLPDE